MNEDLQILETLNNWITKSRFIDKDIKDSWSILEVIFRNILTQDDE